MPAWHTAWHLKPNDAVNRAIYKEKCGPLQQPPLKHVAVAEELQCKVYQHYIYGQVPCQEIAQCSGVCMMHAQATSITRAHVATLRM